MSEQRERDSGLDTGGGRSGVEGGLKENSDG